MELRKEDVFVDHAGFRTLDTMIRARVVYQIQDAIFVSQEFHQARAYFIARESWNSFALIRIGYENI
jgi:SanA protein